MSSHSFSAGVWSATPTPLTHDGHIDNDSVDRLVQHHIDLDIQGLLVGGTCGEGPWLSETNRTALLRTIVKANAGRMTITFQVTDNSAERILENIERAASLGADIAVVASPYWLFNPTPDRLRRLYLDVIDQSSLPVGFYDRGGAGAHSAPPALLREILAHPRVQILKDSSSDPSRREIALEYRQQRSDLIILNGDEFNCLTYAQAGYDGFLLGGGVFNGLMARALLEAVTADDPSRASAVQTEMNEVMQAIYGGKEITCWLAGLKYLLVQMGIFETDNHILGYPLTPECRSAIDDLISGRNPSGRWLRPDTAPKSTQCATA